MKTMKRTVALVLAVVTLVLLISSCGGGSGLSGTYTAKDEMFGLETSYTFSGSNKVKMSALGMNFDGTYKIDGDTIIIKTSVFGIESEESYSFEQSGKNIIIDGIEYVKK